MKRMTLTRLFGKTAEAEKKCHCCNGTGEHASGHECYLCDASGSVPESTSEDEYCDGASPKDYGLTCVYPSHQGMRTTAAEHQDPPKTFGSQKTWTQHRQYASEWMAQRSLPMHTLHTQQESQELADKVTDAAGVRGVTVHHDPSYNYSFQQRDPGTGRSRIVLGNGGNDHLTLLHELAHHVDEQKGTINNHEPHDDSFHNHMLAIVRQHHPQREAAEHILRHTFLVAHQNMRGGYPADPSSEGKNPEPTEAEKALPEPEKAGQLWKGDRNTLAEELATEAHYDKNHYGKHYGGEYQPLDKSKGPIAHQIIARSVDKQLSAGLSPHLVRPSHLHHWITYHPDREGIQQRFAEGADYGSFDDMKRDMYDEHGNYRTSSRKAARAPYREDLGDDRPVTFQYHRNTTPAPTQVNHYHGQDIEPHGQYFTQGPMHSEVPGYETGTKSFKRPLRLYSPTDDPSHPDHWKQQLSRRFNGATGKDLSDAVRRAGYDAILTHDDYGPSESVDLSVPRKQAAPAGESQYAPKPIGHPTEFGHTLEQGVHRGMSVVLPPEVHQVVHDPSQPAHVRANLLLSSLKKSRAKNEGPEGEEGTTGGLGNYWAPSLHKAAEIASQNGFNAYRDHEHAHGCGDEYDGSGGCPVTQVVVHADTPHEKDHWTEQGRPGEKYDPEVSWRLPVRPGTQMKVNGISWRQSQDHEPSEVRYSEEGMRFHHTAPFSRYDFEHPVTKEAKVTIGPGADEHIGEDEYEPDDGYVKGNWDRWHPMLPPTIHRAMGVKLPADHPAHDTSLPLHERAQAVVDHVAKAPYGGGLGMHWTSHPDYLHQHLQTRLSPGDTPVMLHAKTPPREHIEDNGWVHEDRAIRDWDTEEHEVPIKRNAPVHVQGVTWHGPDGWQQHYFDQPVTKRASNPSDHPGRWVWRQKDWDENRPQIEQTKNHDWFTLHAEPADKDEGDGLGRTRMIHAVSHDGQYLGNTFFGDHPTVPGHLEGAFEVNPQHRRKGIASAMYDYAEELHGKPMAPADKHSDYAAAFWKARTAAYVPPGTMGTDTRGHGVQMTTMDGWAHRDGSHGHEDGPDVGQQPVYTHDHTWLPEGRYWGPNSAQNDQRLFEGDHLRPEVRQDILDRVGGVLGAYKDWERWTRVYFAGSEAAKWQPFNGDFDILIGIDFEEFRDCNPQFEEMEDGEIATTLTDELWSRANVQDYFFELKDGRSVGPFDRTFYVNPRAWDIKALHPYAAYNVTSDDWAVHPLEVPKDWDARRLPESYWGYAESLLNEIRAIGQLPPEERHRMAANLYEELHSHRSDAFADGGHGLFDLSNIVEKYLDQHPDKPWAQLVQWKNESPSGTSPWVPTTARRTTLTDLLDSKTAADGADYGGVMIALVPPKKICQSLAQEGGEPVEAMHVTLAYMPDLDRRRAARVLPELVEGWARTQKALTARIGGAGTFVNPGQHVLWAAVDIPHGGPFRQSLVETLERHGFEVANDHGWTPHITLDYRDDHVRFLPKVEPATWDVTEVHVCIGDNWTAVPLS